MKIGNDVEIEGLGKGRVISVHPDGSSCRVDVNGEIERVQTSKCTVIGGVVVEEVDGKPPGRIETDDFEADDEPDETRDDSESE